MLFSILLISRIPFHREREEEGKRNPKNMSRMLQSIINIVTRFSTLLIPNE